MSDEYTERPPIQPLLQEQKDTAALEPQQHSTLAHQFAQQLLMTSFNKKTKRLGMEIADAVMAGVMLNNIALSPARLHELYHDASVTYGNENAYLHAITVKAAREAEQAP